MIGVVDENSAEVMVVTVLIFGVHDIWTFKSRSIPDDLVATRLSSYSSGCACSSKYAGSCILIAFQATPTRYNMVDMSRSYTGDCVIYNG
jgi:hypothetical protein